MTPGALEGIKILDLTAMTAGPVGTMMLGDLGADVIKVEDPQTGELSRSIGTVFVNGESSIFLSQNRNKRSVGLDLKSEDGRAAFLEMAQYVDVVIENFRPGTVDRLGVGDPSDERAHAYDGRSRRRASTYWQPLS
jgi:crotonobetainyl-CoA:carnitine CoA-transferase CaiB-like acyl-CoA transferase